MSLLTKDTFTFDWTVQADYPNWLPATTKLNMNARDEELRLSLNAAINKLNSMTINDSGADNVLAKEISGLVVNLAGTVTKTSGSATLTGLGTVFTTALAVGNYITVPGTSNEIKKVTAITNDTSLTVDSNFANTASVQIAYKANDVQSLLKALKALVDSQLPSPDGSLHDVKLGNDAGDIKQRFTAHLADITQVIDASKFTTTGTDSQKLQAAINQVLTQGFGKVLITRDFTLDTGINIVKDGDFNIVLEAVQGCRVICNTAITALNISGATWDHVTYAKRVQQVYLKGLKITQNGAGYIGTGININGFAFIGLQDIQVIGFDKGYVIADGSELYVNNIRGSGNNYGLWIQRDAGTNDDMAVINLQHITMHNNIKAGVRISGARHVNFIGGVIPTGTEIEGGVIIGSETAPVDLVNFIGTNFENLTTPAVKTLNTAQAINEINFSQCSFSQNSSAKIVINKGLVLNISQCIFDELSPNFVTINSTVPLDFRLKIDNCYPYWSDYSVIDNRSTIKPTMLNLHKSRQINNFNNDMTQSYMGLSRTNGWQVDVANFVTGKQSIKSSGVGVQYAVEYLPWKNGKTSFFEEGTELTIEYIGKLGASTTNAGQIIYAVTSDLNNINLTVDKIIQYSTIQTFTNGFQRVFVKYKVPIGRRVVTIRLTNLFDQASVLNIDYLEIHTDGFPVSNINYVPETLPATIDFEGVAIFVYAGIGVADAYYVCRKSNTEAYSWFQVF